MVGTRSRGAGRANEAASPPGLDLATVGDYKRGLYDRLCSAGVVDNLKSHLRTRILSKLAGHDKINIQANRENLNRKDGLISRVLDSLFTDYLKQNGYDYTLSVFLPESGVQSSSALNLTEVLQMLHIHQTSPLAQTIRHKKRSSEEEQNSSSPACLSTVILGSLADVSLGKALHEAETQTWELSGSSGSGSGSGNLSVAIEVGRIEARMQDKLEAERASLSTIFETKMSEYRRDLEIRSRADVQAQVERVRDIETRSIRIQESAQAWESLAKEKEALDKVHNERLAALKASELETMQRITEKWRAIEAREAESRATIAKERQQIVGERERFDVEITERRAGIERRDKALDERVNAVQVKQIEAEKLLDFAAQQLEQARLMKLRTLDTSGIKSNQPSSPEVALEMLDGARKEASELRKRLIERTRENEDLAKRVRQLESQIEDLVPRENLDRERRAWNHERETLLVRESTWQSALKRANAAVDEAVSGQEDILNQLEEAKSKASMATREASELRAHARELQLALDSNVYKQRPSAISGGFGSMSTSFQLQSRPDASRRPGSSTINMQELEEVEQELRTRLESFKSRSYSSGGGSTMPMPTHYSMKPQASTYSRDVFPQEPRTAIDLGGLKEQSRGERDYVQESRSMLEEVGHDTGAKELPPLMSSKGWSGSTKRVEDTPSPSKVQKASPVKPLASQSPVKKKADAEAPLKPVGDGDVRPGVEISSGSLHTSKVMSTSSKQDTSSEPLFEKASATKSRRDQSPQKLEKSPMVTEEKESPKASTSFSPIHYAKDAGEDSKSESEIEQQDVIESSKESSETAAAGAESEYRASQGSPAEVKDTRPISVAKPVAIVTTPPKYSEVAKGSKSPQGIGATTTTTTITTPTSSAKKSPAKKATPVKEPTPSPKRSPASSRKLELETEGSSTPPIWMEKKTSPGKASHTPADPPVESPLTSPKGKSVARTPPDSPAKEELKQLTPVKKLTPVKVAEERYSPSWSPKASPEKTLARAASPSRTPELKSADKIVSSREEEEGDVQVPKEVLKESRRGQKSPSSTTPPAIDAAGAEEEEEDNVSSHGVTDPPGTASKNVPISPQILSPSREDMDVSSPIVAPFQSPVAEKETSSEEVVPQQTVAQILAQAAEEEQQTSDDAEEVESDIDSNGSLSPRNNSSGDSFGAVGGVMGILPRETPEHSRLGPPMGEPSEDLNIDYSELDNIRVEDMSDNDNDQMSLPEIRSDEMSVASFSGPSGEESNLSIPGLSSEGSVF